MAGNFYPYDYFCGANIFLTVDNQPLLEAAGISYNEMDSMQPIYGYCSRLFDAVAPGQKIIQGSIVINMVDPDYLFESIKRGRRISDTPTPFDSMGDDIIAPGIPAENGVLGTEAVVQTDDMFNIGDVFRNSTTITNPTSTLSSQGVPPGSHTINTGGLSTTGYGKTNPSKTNPCTQLHIGWNYVIFLSFLYVGAIFVLSLVRPRSPF